MSLFYSGEAEASLGRLNDWIREVRDVLDMTLLNKWLWVIIGAAVAIIVFPFLILITLLRSPPWLSATITILIIAAWGIAGGYKDWLIHKRKLEKTKLAGQDVAPFNYERYDEKNQYD